MVNGVALACDDAPSAVERSGKVIVMTGPPVFGTGAVFFEWDGTKLTTIAGPANAANDGAFYGHFLELPTGHLRFSDFSTDLEVFFLKGNANRAWAPKITSVPTTVTHGQTYVVKGTQFSGFTNGAAYGDDFQDSPTMRWCASPTIRPSTFSMPRQPTQAASRFGLGPWQNRPTQM